MSDYSDFDFLPTAPPKKKTNALPYGIIGVLFLILIGIGVYVILAKRSPNTVAPATDALKEKEEQARRLLAKTTERFDSGDWDAARAGINELMTKYPNTAAISDAVDIRSKIEKIIADAREIDGLAATVEGMLKRGNYDGAAQALDIYSTNPAKAAISGAVDRFESLRAAIASERSLDDAANRIDAAINSFDFAAAREALEPALANAVGSLSASRIQALNAKFAEEKRRYDEKAETLFKDCVEKKTIGDYSTASALVSELMKSYPQSAIMEKVGAFNETLRQEIKNRRGIIDQMITNAEREMRNGDIKSASAILRNLPVSPDDLALASAMNELGVRQALADAAKTGIESGADAVRAAWEPAIAAAAAFVQTFPDSAIAKDLSESIARSAAEKIESAKTHAENALNDLFLPQIRAAIDADDFNAALETYKAVADKPDAVKDAVSRLFQVYRRRINRDGLIAEEKLAYRSAKAAPPGVNITAARGLIIKKNLTGPRVPKGAFEEAAAFLATVENKSSHIVIRDRKSVV